jgi:hypothetical protein
VPVTGQLQWWPPAGFSGRLDNFEPVIMVGETSEYSWYYQMYMEFDGKYRILF